MATFIPEWVKVSGRKLHIKRVLNALDDSHVVRCPIRPAACVADIFVQHRDKGWLAIGIEDATFAEIDPAQLFDSERRGQFEQRLVALGNLATDPERAGNTIGALVLMWTCAPDEVRALTREYLGRYGIRLVSREQFAQLGAKLISGLLAPLPGACQERLLGEHFPEVEIPLACTARRVFHRDNRARLDRCFLDVEQERASKLDLELPEDQAHAAQDFSVRLVNGVAGSGKTLIALSRAKILAELNPSQRLLILIHNTPIVADIKERLHRAHGGLPANLDIATFFSWAFQQWKCVFKSHPNVPKRLQHIPDLLKHHRAADIDLKLSDAQLLAELDFINNALILDEASYLDTSRAGRGFALRPKERSQIWALYTALTRSLRASGLLMWSAVPRELCLAGDGHVALQKYHHVLVDEAQFFAPSWFQLVKLSLEADGQLFLCADPNQGFMKNRLSWKSVGLDVAGRTKRLRRSYRTTKAILEAATQVLSALGNRDAEDYLEPDFAGMDAGTRPMLIYTDSPQDSMDRLVNELVAATGAGILPMSAALVIYGEQVSKFGLYKQLGGRFGAGRVWWFNEQDQKKLPPQGYGPDYLRMAYLDTATGLEASVVFLIGIEDLLLGNDAVGLNDDEKAEQREENARKLYMAMTRAGQRLVVVSSQRLPEPMERLFALMP